MHVLYVIQSKKDFTFYIGITPNIQNRLNMHNQGKVFSTRRKIPWELIYCEIYRSKKDVADREQKLKNHGAGWYRLKNRIKNSILNFESKVSEG